MNSPVGHLLLCACHKCQTRRVLLPCGGATAVDESQACKLKGACSAPTKPLHTVRPMGQQSIHYIVSVTPSHILQSVEFRRMSCVQQQLRLLLISVSSAVGYPDLFCRGAVHATYVAATAAACDLSRQHACPVTSERAQRVTLSCIKSGGQRWCWQAWRLALWWDTHTPAPLLGLLPAGYWLLDVCLSALLTYNPTIVCCVCSSPTQTASQQVCAAQATRFSCSCLCSGACHTP